jgi:hypothetical protein
MISFILSEVALRRIVNQDPSGWDMLGRFIAAPAQH